jgi:phage shock protein A
MKWSNILKQENEQAKAKVQMAVDAHADPKAQLALAIDQLQQDHDKLHHTAAQVMAQAQQAHDRLQRDLETQAQLTQRAQMAAAAGHMDAARLFATQLVPVNASIASEQPFYEKAKAMADQAQQAFQENGEMLRQKMLEAKQLESDIDMAAMEHDMNAAMADVTSMSHRAVPTFDQVRDKVQATRSTEEATAALDAGDADISGIHATHLEQQSAVDDIMASLGAFAPPAALPAAPQRALSAPVAADDPFGGTADPYASQSAPRGTTAAQPPDWDPFS